MFNFKKYSNLDKLSNARIVVLFLRYIKIYILTKKKNIQRSNPQAHTTNGQLPHGLAISLDDLTYCKCVFFCKELIFTISSFYTFAGINLLRLLIFSYPISLLNFSFCGLLLSGLTQNHKNCLNHKIFTHGQKKKTISQ